MSEYLMSEEERKLFRGLWVSLKEFNQPLQVGDFVMFETMESIEVGTISKFKDGKPMYLCGCDIFIPVNQIIAVKK